MRKQLLIAAIIVAAIAVFYQRPACSQSALAYKAPRLKGTNYPNLNGLWQSLNEANWDVQAHAARAGAVTQPGIYPYEYARVPAHDCTSYERRIRAVREYSRVSGWSIHPCWQSGCRPGAPLALVTA